MSTVTKGDVTEMKSLANPPVAVKDTMSATLCLLGHGKQQAEDWKFAKKVMPSLPELTQNFEPKAISSKKVDYVKAKLNYSVEEIRKKNAATVSLYTWAKKTLDSLPVEDTEPKS